MGHVWVWMSRPGSFEDEGLRFCGLGSAELADGSDFGAIRGGCDVAFELGPACSGAFRSCEDAGAETGGRGRALLDSG